MTKHPEREVTELTADEMERVSGGAVSVGHNEQILAHFHPITTPGTTRYRPPSKKRPG